MERNITLRNVQQEIWRVEQFAEQIADEFNIFNSYYSNILVSLVECAQESVGEGVSRISFRSEKRGLIFSIEGNFKHVSEDSDIVFLIDKLSDQASYDDHSIELVFSIHSINKELSAKRKSAFMDYLKGVSVEEKENNGI